MDDCKPLGDGDGDGKTDIHAYIKQVGGRTVQVDSIKPVMKAPGSMLLKPRPDRSAFKRCLQSQLAPPHGGKLLGQDEKKKTKKEKRKRKAGRSAHPPMYAEDTVEYLAKVPFALLICASIYTSEIVRIWSPSSAIVVFFLSMCVRSVRVTQLWNYFRKKEMDLHANMTRVALLKFFIMVFGLSHWVGSGFGFINPNPNPPTRNPKP